MKKKKLFMILMSVFLLSIIFTGCSNQTPIQGDKGIVQPKAADKDASDVKSPKQPNQEPDMEIVKMKEGQLSDLGEDISYEGGTLRVQNIKVTKEIGDREKQHFNYWGEEMDAEGNLTGAQSYIFVTLSDKNVSEQTQQLLLNANGFVYDDDNGQLFESTAEARYIDNPQNQDRKSEQLFHYILKPGEETGEIEIGYIAEDTDLNNVNGYYFCIGNRGSTMGDSENRYIKVIRSGD